MEQSSEAVRIDSSHEDAGLSGRDLLPSTEAVRTRVVQEGETISDAARELLPQLAKKNVRAAQAVISQILRSILSAADYKKIAKRNRALGVTKGGYSFHPEGFEVPSRKHQPKDGNKKPHWLPEEEDALRKILADQTGAYRYKGGLHDGALSFPLIAQVLNDGFRDVRASRSANSVFRFVKRMLKNTDAEETSASDGAEHISADQSSVPLR